MTVSKINFFDCLSEMQWIWRKQSHSLFENVKHNTVNIDIMQLEGEKYEWNASWYVCMDIESLLGTDIPRNEISMWGRMSDFDMVLHPWPMYVKERILSSVSREAKSVLQTVLLGMQTEKFRVWWSRCLVWEV
jgi:hypothetical protein